MVYRPIRMRKTLYGYLDMGDIEIPAMPPHLLLKDRTTGGYRFLSIVATDDDEYDPAKLGVGFINSELSTITNVRKFEEFEGPYIQTANADKIYTVRLYADNGALNFEEVTTPPTVRQPRAIAVGLASINDIDVDIGVSYSGGALSLTYTQL